MSHCGIFFKMRMHVSTNSLRNLWQLLWWLFSRLFLFALLASIVQKWTLQSLGDEVSSYSVLNNASTWYDLLKNLARISRLDERFLLLRLILCFLKLRFGFDKRDVFRTLNSKLIGNYFLICADLESMGTFE
jgi:hypothetical protein